MKPSPFTALVVFVVWCCGALAQNQMADKEFSRLANEKMTAAVRASFEKHIDDEINALAEKLSAQVKESGRKKVAVLEFTDLQDNASELGRFLAAEVSVSLVERRAGAFTVINRMNLAALLAEENLTEKNLVDPKNSERFKKASGVEAIIIGKFTALKDEVTLVAYIIATDTAETVGAVRARLPMSKEIEQLLSNATPPRTIAPKSDEPKTGDAATRAKGNAPSSEAGTGDYGFTNTKKVTVFTVYVYYREGADTNRTITVPPGQTQYVYGFPAGRHNYMVTYRAQVPIMPFPPGAPTMEQEVAYLRGEIYVEQGKSGVLEIK